MSAPIWPSYWEHIPEEHRDAITDILGELLGTGVIFGEAGRDRERYELARQYQRELTEYLGPLAIELFEDPERPILQARPVPGRCPLVATFSKDESLVALTLWRLYHDHRMTQTSDTVLLSANDLDRQLRIYFERITPPSPSLLEKILTKLRRKRLIRYRPEKDRLGESSIEILPTLARAIPFDSEEWAAQVATYQDAAMAAEQEP